MRDIEENGLKYRHITKREAALKQIRVAIKLLEEEEFEAAITLAGAAEGMMLKGAQPIAMFEQLKELRPADFRTEPEWVSFLNALLYWLKHSGDQESNVIGEFDAWVMIVRALTKYHGTFDERPPEVDALMAWGKARNEKLRLVRGQPGV